MHILLCDMEIGIHENPALYFKAKAAEAGIRIDMLCDESGVARSTLTRWQSNDDSATLGSIRKLKTSLEKLINKKSKRRSNSSSEAMSTNI